MIDNNFLPKLISKPAYSTDRGQAYCGDSLEILSEFPDNSINLVMTSPPFALLRKKEYGNKDQHEYLEWLSEFAKIVLKKLKPDGSFVLDLGGAYKKGVPARSLYNFRVPIHFCDNLGFHLAEDFYWFNPSKLPSPIEWVNKRKIRVKDSVNTVWWFSKTEFPKANAKNVLVEYSDRMKKLLDDPDKYYDPMKRPSGHNIGKSFGKDNGGAIPSNLLQIPNSESNGSYMSACKIVGAKRHPARFPSKLPEFFIRFLTEPEDIVVDIFSGSNTTGYVAEREKRNWISIDSDLEYTAASTFRFLEKQTSDEELQEIHNKIMAGDFVNIEKYRKQLNMFREESAVYEA